MEKAYNLEAEQQVLACLLQDDPVALSATHTLQAEDFGDPRHQLVFAAIKGVLAKQQAPSYVTVLEELTQRNRLEAIGGLEYLLQLNNSYVTTGQLQSNIDIIKQRAGKRGLYRLGLQLQSLSQDSSTSPLEIVEQCKQSLQRVVTQQQVVIKDKVDLLCEYKSELIDAIENPEATKGLSTGFVEADLKLQGLRKGNLIILGARPSMGKTALALNIAEAASRNEGKEPKRVLFVSLEMKDLELTNRLMSSMTGIDGVKLREPRLLSEGEREAMEYAMNAFYENSLELIEEHHCTLPRLRQLCYSFKQDKGLDMVVIDYMGLLVGDAKQDRYTQVSEISKGLKGLASELEVPIIALCQLNRGVESRVNKEPMMSDLRDSGTIEQDADVVLLLYRDDFYNPYNSKEPNIARLIISKNRHGTQGEVKLYFDKQHSRFLEVS